MTENEYNLYCDNDFIGTYSTSELAERFNMTTGTITEYGRLKKKYKRHYEWHKIYQATKKPLDKKTLALMDEWDRVTEPYRNRK